MLIGYTVWFANDFVKNSRGFIVTTTEEPEMSDRRGIVRYFWGERTAIMNGVATIRNGLALGGSNRIAGGT